jgi:polysaccharide export outer membrane protein
MQIVNFHAGLLRRFEIPTRVFACLAVLLLFSPILSHGLEYAVGDGDLLKITVYNNPDLTSEVRVSGEGMITVPLIGEVFVNEMTATDIGKKLADLFANGYIKKPQVAVFIQEYKSKKVTTLGEFTKPGLIEMRGNSTLMEVISNAGGITANAGETLFIQRNAVKGGGSPKDEIIISIDLIKLLEGKDLSANVPVLDGDSIYVPKAAFVYVSGEVKTPGAYKITKGLTVLRSITLAGGLTIKANQNKVEIVRKVDNAEQSIRVKMEDPIMPDDIIVVPESFF